MLWPPDDLMRASQPFPDDSRSLRRARISRLARALQKTPRSLRAIARGSDNVSSDALDFAPRHDQDR